MTASIASLCVGMGMSARYFLPLAGTLWVRRPSMTDALAQALGEDLAGGPGS